MTHPINYLPLVDPEKSTTGCCTLIEPKEWDEQVFVFNKKLFARARVRCFMYVPLTMSSVMKKAQEAIDAVGGAKKGSIALCKESSPWHSDLYFAVNKAIPGMKMERLSGTFITKVFERPYKDAHKWHVQLNDFVKQKGEMLIQPYFFYTVCPDCAKAYGKNYVVGFAQVV